MEEIPKDSGTSSKSTTNDLVPVTVSWYKIIACFDVCKLSESVKTMKYLYYYGYFYSSLNPIERSWNVGWPVDV